MQLYCFAGYIIYFPSSQRALSYVTLAWRVTLYVKVTWSYKWPILSRALYMLDTWFFCFHCSLGQGNQCVMTYKVLAYKVTRQGHVWPILSRALDMLDTCFFPWFVGSRKTKACRPDTWYVTLTRDLVRQGHVILQVIYVILGPVHIYTTKRHELLCFHC